MDVLHAIEKGAETKVNGRPKVVHQIIKVTITEV
jgi:hypothetical protein